MVEYKIEEIKLENLEEAIRVIEITFLKFEAPDYSKEGVENFLNLQIMKLLKKSLMEI